MPVQRSYEANHRKPDKIGFLPVKYYVEFCENYYQNDPVFTVCASEPLFNMAVGDEIDPQGWPDNELPLSDIYVVSSVRHSVFEVEASHIVHSMFVIMSVKPREPQIEG
jgi:hypothetical protein